MSSPFLVPVAGLFLLYLWLRGWWFAGLIVGFLYCFWNANPARSYLIGLALAFGPAVFWYYVREDRRIRSEKGAQARADYFRQISVLPPVVGCPPPPEHRGESY